MKCSKAVKINKLSRLGFLSVVTLMALSLSGNSLLAADDFKMWHLSIADSKPVALEHLSSDDKSDVAKLISDKKFSEFAKKNSSEPFKFVEGIKEAWLKAKDKTTAEDFKKSILEGFKKVESKEFGSETKKTAFLDLLNEAFEKGFKSEDFVKELFTDKDVVSLWATLAITDKDKEAKPTETPTPSSTTTTKSPAPVTRPNTNTGEIDDSALRRQAQAICDQMNALKNSFEKNFTDQVKPIKDALAELFNKQAETPTVNPNVLNQKKNEKGIEDVLPGLLANALQEQQKNDDVQPAPQSQQPAPTQSRRDDDTDSQALNQPLPEPLPQQNNINPYMGNMFSSTQQVNPRLELPSDSGRQALRDAQDLADVNDMRQPVDATLSPNAGLPELVMAKSKLKGDIQRTSIALQDTKDKAGRLEEELEGLKEGARAALNPETKRAQAQMEADITSKKAEMQQLQQAMMMLQGDSQQQYQQMLQMKQQEVGKLEQDRNQLNAKIDVTIEQGNAEIKKLKKRADNLNSVAKKLEGQLQGMKTDETTLTQLVNTNIQMQQAQMQPQGGQIQNVSNGTRLQQGGAPRTQGPRLGNALATPTSANSGAVRGPLAK